MHFTAAQHLVFAPDVLPPGRCVIQCRVPLQGSAVLLHFTHLLMVLNEKLHHDILELDVHDGRHRLFLGAEQGGAKHHAQIGHRHQVLLVVIGHAVQVDNQ